MGVSPFPAFFENNIELNGAAALVRFEKRSDSMFGMLHYLKHR